MSRADKLYNLFKDARERRIDRILVLQHPACRTDQSPPPILHTQRLRATLFSGAGDAGGGLRHFFPGKGTPVAATCPATIPLLYSLPFSAP
jgi:hypothetical protein